MDRSTGTGTACKFGEFPPFGPPTPARVISLIGPDKDYYLKGRQAETHGLGIAAFAYYRRVVENQKNRIYEEIIKVSNQIGSDRELIAELESAKEATQFTSSVEKIKRAMPQVLLIKGHNPLTLLYAALSDGLHDQTDEHCLQLATNIRIVLTELVDRMATALKENKELNAAVSELLQKKNPA